MGNRRDVPRPERFERCASDRERLRELVSWAVLAPSGHNAQPWSFRLNGDALELRADQARSLPVVDTRDRELIISCGAALHHIRVAALALGCTLRVNPLPDANEPTLLARLTLTGAHGPSVAELGMLAAIPRRRTVRARFARQAVGKTTLAELCATVVAEGGWTIAVEAGQRAAIAELIAQGTIEQWADRAFRDELSQWLRDNRSQQRDGIPGDAFGIKGDLLSRIAPAVVRILNLGRMQARRERALVAAAPALVILGTERDDASAWLAIGQGLSRLLLEACRRGLCASFLNQPIERLGLRQQVAATVDRANFPQLIVRLGYCDMTSAAKPTPRRPSSDVWIDE